LCDRDPCFVTLTLISENSAGSAVKSTLGVPFRVAGSRHSGDATKVIECPSEWDGYDMFKMLAVAKSLPPP
jgi:hypothetical protein